tara:strand:- start:41 stop:493 length:453 start_codon:yes stop_codon:yes gene_type:complete
MRTLTLIGIAVLIAGTSAFLITPLTHADTQNNVNVSVSTGTHKVWMPNQGIFKLKRFGEYCMPGDLVKGPIPLNAELVGTETRECEHISHRFRRVFYENYSGWMWDYALEELDPMEGEIPDTEVKIPVIIREEDTLGSTLPTISPEPKLP